MNNNELNAMLNEMDSEERELTLAADDAYDRLYAYRLQKEFGVTVECNPDGDRTKVKIDGEIMNQDQFTAWLMSKRLAELSGDLDSYAHSSNTAEELPSEETIYYGNLDGAVGSRSAAENYLRNKYDHYLAGGTSPDIVWEDDHATVTNIQWGRKR